MCLSMKRTVRSGTGAGDGWCGVWVGPMEATSRLTASILLASVLIANLLDPAYRPYQDRLLDAKLRSIYAALKGAEDRADVTRNDRILELAREIRARPPRRPADYHAGPGPTNHEHPQGRRLWRDHAGRRAVGVAEERHQVAPAKIWARGPSRPQPRCFTASMRTQTLSRSDIPALPRLLRITEVVSATALSKPTIWRYCAAGSFPRPAYISPARRPAGTLRKSRNGSLTGWRSGMLRRDGSRSRLSGG